MYIYTVQMYFRQGKKGVTIQGLTTTGYYKQEKYFLLAYAFYPLENKLKNNLFWTVWLKLNGLYRDHQQAEVFDELFPKKFVTLNFKALFMSL